MQMFLFSFLANQAFLIMKIFTGNFKQNTRMMPHVRVCDKINFYALLRILRIPV